MCDGVSRRGEHTYLVVREFKVHRTLADDTTHAVDLSLDPSNGKSTVVRVTYGREDASVFDECKCSDAFSASHACGPWDVTFFCHFSVTNVSPLKIRHSILHGASGTMNESLRIEVVSAPMCHCRIPSYLCVRYSLWCSTDRGATSP